MTAAPIPAPIDAATLGPRIVALPMYDPPELHAANDGLWTAIATRLAAEGVKDAPERLTRGGAPEAAWTHPDLLLAQTCGYPFATSLQNRVALIATPRYGALGCDGPFYRSAVVVRADAPATSLADLRGARCAVNDLASNSGMNLLRVEIAPLAQEGPFFGAVAISGSHEASAAAVADAEADVAAIDCVTWALLQRFRPKMTRRLRVLTWTVRSPGLPFITSARTDTVTRAALLRALEGVARDPSLSDVRAELMLEGFESLPAQQYRAILHLERIAAAQGYPQLA
jgi:ABC-type phosphate/phosphonate transport system substrate-binding protein